MRRATENRLIGLAVISFFTSLAAGWALWQVLQPGQWLLMLTLYLYVITPVMVCAWFSSYSRYTLLRDSGDWDALPKIVRYPWLIFIAYGLKFDVFWNIAFGSIFFSELPREFLFTDRVQRHVDSVKPFTAPQNWRQEVGVDWARWLNLLDPGHVDMPKGWER